MSSPRETSRLFTVVVPTYGRAESLRRCLAALAAQTLPPSEWNLIVVDDGGREDLTPVIAEVRETVQVDLLRQPHSGPAAARNAGAAAATGRYLAFTDDDCAPAPGWLAAFAAGFERFPEDMLGGSIVNGVRGNAYSEVSQALVSYLYDYYNGNGTVRFLTSNNIAMPLDRFRSLGGFSRGFPLAAAEDRDFCERWLNAGHRMTFVPDAVVEHHHDLRFRTFWQQHFNYGRGARRFHRARARLERDGLRVEPLRFYLGLLNYPFAQWRFTSALNRAALTAITQVANAAG
ncbi:MAG TPA: glycosyltransferase, partial [Vicinamibacterales bacterium]|nr:glycosyltransferase [Vicinamibacterales bacterium]